MSSEWGLLGLARRTYSSYRPPDAISVRLFRFIFASVAKQFPKEAEGLGAAAQENAQWRYKSYLRMLGTAW